MRAWIALLLVALTGVMALAGYAWANLRDLPAPGDTAALIRGIDVYARDGTLLAQRDPNGEFHVYLPLSQMGRYGPAATLAAEDRGFYQHGPVDGPALLRAAVTDAVNGRIVEGGSTITQQLVKLELLGPQQTVSRKLKEAFLAWAMERRYTKDQILEMYLNRVYYGHGAYGLGAAVETYFGRDRRPADLTPAQAAFLAGLLQAPNGLDPVTNYAGARARELYVLQGMEQMGVLSPAQEQQAEREDIRAELKLGPASLPTIAPHFVQYVLSQAEQLVGAAVFQQGGLEIHTTLDPSLQALAERSVSDGVRALARYRVNNGDLLAVRPSTGEVLAWVGSADPTDDAIGGQVDVVRAERQPGSSFKPYVYEAALRDRTITLCTVLQDRPMDFGGYRPVDWDGRFLGPMTAARALVLSRNVPAVEVGQAEGIANVIRLARAMGIDSPLKDELDTAIGGSEVTMLEQVQGYSVFADQGVKVPLVAITSIDDLHGDPLYQVQPGQQPGRARVLTPAEAYLITDTLKRYQDQWDLGWNRQMASKSGTSGGSQVGVNGDAWMMAYNPDIVVGAWAGNTGPNGQGGTISAFGVNVGQTVVAEFLNHLPAGYRDWYTRPSGLVARDGTLFLPGTQQRSCRPSAAAATPALASASPPGRPAEHGHRHR
ncbi:MAG TPA: transglycosylase domain-containing protein [Candidatus Dormibacteraeota bacterium]|nr:transglycosylase domain-containing protein [Candidatus Dormibacteraeota bacterium]